MLPIYQFQRNAHAKQMAVRVIKAGLVTAFQLIVFVAIAVCMLYKLLIID